MISLRRGVVRRIARERAGAQFLEVELPEGLAEAICFTALSNECAPGDEVLLNTTAVELGLGTGGWHFVVANLSRPERQSSGAGHIMKLRYTPLQVRVLAGAEDTSPLGDALQEGASLHGTPVVVLPLHSALAPAAVAFANTAPAVPLAYVMTDAAALPIALSDTVAALRERELLRATVTSGHAFGGDAEAVGIHDGLLLAAALAKGGAVLVGPGPGIVGTGTTFGTTALEQGQIVNAVQCLHGRCVIAPRIGLADERSRHRGISHHTVTALTVAALVPAIVAFPEGYPELLVEAQQRLLCPRADGRPGLAAEYLRVVDASQTSEWLKARGLWPKSMGRTPDEDPAFFEAAAAAGILAGQLAADRDVP